MNTISIIIQSLPDFNALLVQDLNALLALLPSTAEYAVLYKAAALVAYTFAAIFSIVFLAHIPVLPLIRLALINVPNKTGIAGCMLGAWVRSALTIIPDLLAPIVVPVALLFTKWEDEHLPRIFWMWDNDASINGDRRTDDPEDGMHGWRLRYVPLDKDSQEAIDMCYYAEGHHPRSFYARWVWLGLRNRASALSQALGKAPFDDPETFSGKTWEITKVGDVYRFYEVLPISNTLSIRMHCGYKVPLIPGESKAAAVSIGFSLRINKIINL